MKLVLAIFVFVSFLSCKKDKLEGDRDILNGTWNWIYTKNSDIGGSYPTTYTYAYNVSDNYSIKFLKKGKIMFIKNDKKENCYRLVFDSFKFSLYDNKYWFDVYLDNKEKNFLRGSIEDESSDTLTLMEWFPFESPEDNITSYNYFIREN